MPVSVSVYVPVGWRPDSGDRTTAGKRLTAKRLLLGNRRRERKDFDNNISSQHKAWHDQLVNFVRLVLPPEAPYSVR